MIKRLITILSLTCMALNMHAESKYMTVEETDGSSISFFWEDNPVIIYQGGTFVTNKASKCPITQESMCFLSSNNRLKSFENN